MGLAISKKSIFQTVIEPMLTVNCENFTVDQFHHSIYGELFFNILLQQPVFIIMNPLELNTSKKKKTI